MATYQREQYRPQTSLNLLPYFLLAIVSLVLVWQMWPRNPPPEPRAVTPRGELAEEEKSNIALFKESLPSVVHIDTAVVKRYDFNIYKIPKGTGSGFVWDHQGHIVTN